MGHGQRTMQAPERERESPANSLVAASVNQDFKDNKRKGFVKLEASRDYHEFSFSTWRGETVASLRTFTTQVLQN